MDVPLQPNYNFYQNKLPCSVSILVLMDVPLQLGGKPAHYITNHIVSILVLMDVPLQLIPPQKGGGSNSSFNPCFNGCSSSTFIYHFTHLSTIIVSILVLMDVPLQLSFSDNVASSLEFQSLF